MAKTDLVFNQLTFSVSNFHETKTILNDMYGTFPSGKLIGILGPSGAGKTTLLNVLSGWDQSEISGSIEVNNKTRNIKQFKNISSYVTQDCYLIDVLTVEENLTYAADFKLGHRVSKIDKQNIVKSVVDSFGLTKHLKTMTGKLSGGQRKRLAICMVLINDPDIVFLDEPTTGLDIVAMSRCMRYLKQLTEKGHTAICTLHQPPDNIVKMFDILYVIADGQCIYQGGPHELVKFLDDCGVPCALYHSPLDFIIEIANREYSTKILDDLLEISQNGKNHQYMPHFILNEESNNAEVKKSTLFSRMCDDSLMDHVYELKTMLKRGILVKSRDKLLLFLQTYATIVSFIMVGLVCYNVGQDVTKFYYNYNIMLMHVAVVAIAFSAITTIAFVFNQNILRNEYENGYYTVKTYFISTTILDLPLNILVSAICAFLTYWLSGQIMTSDRVSMFIILTIEQALVANSLGFLIGTVFNFAKAVFATVFIHMAIFVVSGFGLSMTDMPTFFHYTSYLSYTKYCVRSYMGTIFGYNRPRIVCPEDVQYCHYPIPSVFLKEQGLEDFYFMYDAVTLIGFYVTFRFVSYLAISFRLKNGVYAK